MSGGFSLGFLTRVYQPAFNRKVYHETLELFKAAEALEFDCGWVAQHHFASEQGRLPSPLVLLAAIAQATRRIRLGSGVIVLPQEPPLRLAEDASVLDLLSGGRLELGLGAGFDPATFSAFGGEHARRHQDYDDHLQRLYSALSDRPLNAAGARLQPRTAGLGQRLWEATSRVEAVAARGNGLIMAPNPQLPSEAAGPWLQRYRQAWPAQQPTRPRAAWVQAVFPEQYPDREDSTLRRDILAYAQRQRHIGVYQGPLDDDISVLLKRLGVLHGSSQAIIDVLGEGPRLGVGDHWVVQVQTASTSLRDAIRALETFRERIAPALGWRPRGAQGSPLATEH
ncbi:LLM class flavin-dependent oxidoreductase [Pseudomonas typographi]|uniref:LLM class flavin-dependent oxidoreductase n=1 Tax=Pseudomonas typographi TaxID=2715964 RepID=UPI001682D0AA|nr:LLM class flavin-dependent oxidoreductase [Pseudomonas typographi]MBD1552633.1 LLM class flavin-dependent oxidoreductase [Pseudomonas typographi]MBD1586214.1 LLM class flavin-dependent oxidoreductase [Pseudomonas typographi]